MLHVYEEGVPRVGGLKFSMAQKKLQKVPVGGNVSLVKCQSRAVPVGGQVPVAGQKFNLWTNMIFSQDDSNLLFYNWFYPLCSRI